MRRGTAPLGTLLAVLFMTVGAVAEPAPARLRVLSYNLHGLPGWIAGDDPEWRMPLIGERLARFDAVLLQEDFDHHERLAGASALTPLRRGSESRHGWCPFCNGDGLTLGISPRITLEALTNHPYSTCNGWFGSANDCLATKGFQLARITLQNGASLHLLNTHLDAGRGDADREARAQQIREIVETVRAEVGDGALVVAGDLNLNAKSRGDVDLRVALQEALRLDDSGARADPESDWAVLDYILYRSGADTELRIVAAGESMSFAVDGRALSDHPAIYAEIEARPR